MAKQMSDEIITSTAASIAVGGYAAAKFFEPILKRMGESTADFVTARVRKVFRRADEIRPTGEPIELEPGFLRLFVERVSYSTDDDDLTERWANLLADAALAFSNKHVNYVDILSQLGPLEVSILDQITAGRERTLSQPPNNIFPVIRAALATRIRDHGFSKESASIACQTLFDTDLPWPGVVVGADVPYQEDGTSEYVAGGIHRGWDSVAIDILVRQRLLEGHRMSLQSSIPSATAQLLLVTGLGLGFVRACKGLPDPDHSGT
jgi:hypothetical protein